MVGENVVYTKLNHDLTAVWRDVRTLVRLGALDPIALESVKMLLDEIAVIAGLGR